MLNLRARQYEPATMRFSQRDIIRGFSVIPSTQNRYAYCLNNPIVFTDPSGEFVIAALLIGAAIGAIIGGVSSYKAQKAATGKVDGWKVAKNALIGGVVGAVAGLVGAAVAGALATAVGATSLTAAGVTTTLTMAQSIGVASVSAISAGVAARATNAAVRNSFTSEPKRVVVEEAFNPKAMTTDAILGAGFGALTHLGTGGLYNTTSIDSRYKGGTTLANPKRTQSGKTSGNTDNPLDDVIRDSSGEYAGEQYGGATQGKNAGTTACTAGQSADDVAREGSNLVQLSRQSVQDKLARYLLNMEHSVGGSKAKWFKEALGYTQENLDDLANQISFDPSKARITDVTTYGTKYNQTIAITGANGKTIDIVFAWIKSAEDGVVRLVTAIPTK